MKFLNSLILMLFLFPLTVSSGGKEDDFGRHCLGMSGALTSSDTWQVDLSYHFMLTRNIGVGAALGSWKQYFIDGFPSGPGWEIDSEDEKISNFYLRPSVLLVSPRLFSLGLWNFALRAEPGVMMNVPYQGVCIDILEDYHTVDYKHISTSRGQWCAFECKAGIEANFMYGTISAGYMFSTLDIYGISRNLHYNGVSFGDFYPKAGVIHGAYLSLSFNI